MFDFAVCEISGKQYKVIPNQPFLVDLLGDKDEKVEAEVLLLSEAGKVKFGTPFLKEKLILEILENIKTEKIRVAKFHAKANFRKVTGIRPKKTKIVYAVKKFT